MGGISLEGDVSSLKNQIKRLSEVDLKRLNASLAEVVRTSTMERFKTGKDPEGNKWDTSRRVRDIGGTTLSDTGALRKSLHSKISGEGFALGTNLKYAATHQFGDKDREIRARKSGGLHFQIGGKWMTVKAVRVSIPARPYLGINEDDIKEISATIEDEFMED